MKARCPGTHVLAPNLKKCLYRRSLLMLPVTSGLPCLTLQFPSFSWAVRLRIINSHDKRTLAICILLIQLAHILLIQLKAIQICILRNTLRVIALR